jgi:hypothetical protein
MSAFMLQCDDQITMRVCRKAFGCIETVLVAPCLLGAANELAQRLLGVVTTDPAHPPTIHGMHRPSCMRFLYQATFTVLGTSQVPVHIYIQVRGVSPKVISTCLAIGWV